MDTKTQQINPKYDLDNIDKLLEQCPELKEVADFGVDIHILLDNLRRPLSERIRRHQIALDTLNSIRKAGQL